MARKPGKYDHVVNDLPRMLGENPAYQDKVNALKDALRADPDFLMQASFLAKEYIGLRDEKDAIKLQLSACELRLEAVSQLLFAQYEAEGVSTMTIAGRPVTTRLVPYAKAEDPEAFRQWCLKDADLARKMALPWATINSLASNMLANGEELPPGITIFAKERFTLGGE